MNVHVNKYSFWLAKRKQALQFMAFDNRVCISDWSHSNPDAVLDKQKKTINTNRHKANFTQKQLAKSKKERKGKESHSLSKQDHQSHYSCSKYKLFVLLVARGGNSQNNHTKKKKAIAKQNSDTPLSIASLSQGARLFNPPEPSPA